MTRKMYKLLFLAVALSSTTMSYAQGDKYSKATPKDQWEIGLNLGHAFLSGDIEYKPGFVGGIHIRKSLDYVFSLRGDIYYGATSGDNPDDGATATRFLTHDSKFLSGDINAVITLNNLRWDKPVHKFNPYVFGGIGFLSSTIDYTNIDNERKTLDGAITPNFGGGAGISYRISNKINVGLEHKASMSLGNRADLLDGYDNAGKAGRFNGTTFRDVINYTTLNLNFNIGGKDKSEPLWWVNPMEAILTDVDDLKKREKIEFPDTDKDGVPDMWDQEKNSPAGAAVDTRGLALDSDGDGYPDYKDKEPYSPPGYKVDASGIAQVPKGITEADVTRIVDGKLVGIGKPVPTPAGLSDWMLPIVNFDYDKYGIKPSEVSKLRQVASVLQSNPSISVVAYGYTDKAGGDSYNQVLSYNRANAAVEYLVKNFGISRDRLIIKYGGEGETLIQTGSPNYINRRVEFRVAKAGDSDQGRPAGPNAGKPGFNGSRNDGY